MLISNKSKIFRLIISMLLCCFFFTAFGISSSAQITCTIPFTGKVNDKTVNGNAALKFSNELYLYPGDIVYLNFTYSSSNSNVQFGVVDPSGTFRYFVGTSGLCKKTYTVKQEGIHKVRIKNNSETAVTVNGNFSTGCSYPFRNTQIATNISNSYSSSHYGLDIIETYPKSINGYAIYSIGSGTVEYENLSETAGYYVAIIGDGGYTTRYLHMKSRALVRKGNNVTYNTLLGYVGNTGKYSTGPHLHLDINTVNGIYGGSNSNNVNYTTTIDPKKVFPQISFS